MIEPVDPSLDGPIVLALRDPVGGHLTVHREATPIGTLTGVVMSDGEGACVSFAFDREDRAALIRVLIEMQETEAL